MKPFILFRKQDVSGVSGTGVIAVGVVMPSGRAVMEWVAREYHSLGIYSDIEELINIHGHEGSTEVRWVEAQWDELLKTYVH